MIPRPILSLSLLAICGFALLGTCVSRSGEFVGDFQRRMLPDGIAFRSGDTPDVAQRMLQDDLVNLGQGFAGSLGIAVIDIEDGALMQFNGTQPFPQQSISKLWVAMTALDMVDQGTLSLDEPVTIRREDLTLFHQPIRAIVMEHGSFATTYGELLYRAITQSDNTANDRLLRRVGGPEAVEAFIRRNDIQGVRFGTDERTKQSEIAGLTWNPVYSLGRSFYDARERVPARERQAAFENYIADPSDGASAKGMARALEMLARGELLSDASTQFLIDTISHTKSGPKRLKGGVPEGWSIAHKTGTGQEYLGEQAGFNDVAILTAPDGARYAIAVLVGSTRAPFDQRFAMMQGVTQAVVRYHDGRQLQSTD